MPGNCICRIELQIDDVPGIEWVLEDEAPLILEVGDAVIIGGLAPVYDGAVEVVPRINEVQVLETNEKLMPDDITVHAIPVTHTSNPYGGKTVLIG